MNGKYQVNYAERVYEPFVPDEFIDGDASEEAQEYEDIIRAERQSACRTALYHCIRVFLGREENEFPWNSAHLDAAKTACEDFLKEKGFTVPSVEQVVKREQAPARVADDASASAQSS